jgi:hypothetical protein
MEKGMRYVTLEEFSKKLCHGKETKNIREAKQSSDSKLCLSILCGNKYTLKEKIMYQSLFHACPVIAIIAALITANKEVSKAITIVNFIKDVFPPLMDNIALSTKDCHYLFSEVAFTKGKIDGKRIREFFKDDIDEEHFNK